MIKSRDFEKEAHSHWNYTREVARRTGSKGSNEEWDVRKFFYVQAMIHGYKHGIDDGFGKVYDWVSVFKWVGRAKKILEEELTDIPWNADNIAVEKINEIRMLVQNIFDRLGEMREKEDLKTVERMDEEYKEIFDE